MNTSVNLHVLVVKQIDEFSEKSRISKSKIVSLLIEKVKLFKSIEVVEGLLIEYQDRISNLNEENSSYERVHYYPDSDLVNFTKKLRYKYRISISKFVAAAFLFFWTSIIKEFFDEDELVNELNNYEEILRIFAKLKEYFRERLNYYEIKPIKLE